MLEYVIRYLETFGSANKSPWEDFVRQTMALSRRTVIAIEILCTLELGFLSWSVLTLYFSLKAMGINLLQKATSRLSSTAQGSACL